MLNISVIGLGFVGGSMKKSFEIKNSENDVKICIKGYDKYKEDTDTFEDCLNSDITFLCLPTVFDENKNEYDKSCIIEVCTKLEDNKFKGIVVIKSTVEPTTTNNLALQFKTLKFIHNPEFLTAATAFEDFHNQKHVVLGASKNVTKQDVKCLGKFYKRYYPKVKFSLCTCTESESMKIYVNCFYAVKIQFFNELYLLCKKMNCDYDTVREMMFKNKWINPMHTNVPGTDGQMSYGGYCFPKDTNALLNHMIRENTPCKVLRSTVLERNEMRKDNINITIKNNSDIIELNNND